MKSQTVPQGPYYNPDLEEGIYDAKIVDLVQGEYGKDKDMYLQVILRVKEPECYVVSNLYFPKGKPDSKTVQRLSRLSQICGLVPQDALDSPRDFKGAELKVQIKRFKNDGREYSDVSRFLHPDVVVTT